MNTNKLAEDKYKYFSDCDGNDHISSIYALKTILKLIDDFKVKSVLEIGLGIGSISDTILTYSESNQKNIKYVGTDEDLNSIANYSNKRALIFIEGFRITQVNTIKNIFPNYIHVEIISKEKNPNYGPFSSDNWSGGGQLIFINPNLYQRYYWLKEKLNTYLKRRLRRFV
jgi:hypothetical protein